MRWCLRFLTLINALIVVLAASPVTAVAQTKYIAPDPREVRRVSYFLQEKDCPGAVAAMKEGIKARQPDVLLVAASMMEDGICIKADWDKAVNLYLLADQAGSAAAKLRLVAGLAVAGRDNGQALWHAAQSGKVPPACKLAADPLKDPDGFNDALEKMPPALFKGCVYMTGVMHEMAAYVRYPQHALEHGVQADVVMEFTPAEGKMTWRYGAIGPGVLNGTHTVSAAYEDEKKITDSLMIYLVAKGKQALARYSKPDGIDPDLVLKTEFSFNIE